MDRTFKYLEKPCLIPSIKPRIICTNANDPNTCTLLAKHIAQELDLVYLGPSTLLQTAYDKQEILLNEQQKLKELLANGKSVDNELVLTLLKYAVSLPNAVKYGWILDGFTLSIAQLNQLDQSQVKPNTLLHIGECSESLIQTSFSLVSLKENPDIQSAFLNLPIKSIEETLKPIQRHWCQENQENSIEILNKFTQENKALVLDGRLSLWKLKWTATHWIRKRFSSLQGNAQRKLNGFFLFFPGFTMSTSSSN